VFAISSQVANSLIVVKEVFASSRREAPNAPVLRGWRGRSPHHCRKTRRRRRRRLDKAVCDEKIAAD
jgi:hypothetical protein